MPRPSRLVLAKDDIIALFNNASKKIYSKADLAGVLLQSRRSWHLADHTTTADLIAFLIKQGDLKSRKLRSGNYSQEVTRYSWGRASTYEMALSIKPHAYLCHGTAAALHGLLKPNPNEIYLNSEQSPKLTYSGLLTQDSIDRAFSREQRQSNLIYTHGALSVTLISGKNTKRLGVEERVGPSSEPIAVTNLERTLIDIVVRPAYAGDASQVLKAYRAAKARVSVEGLLDILQKLDYIYPYHQAIGFLMQAAEFPEKSYAKMHTLGLKHDFYLAHAMQQPAYSDEWRLFYPKDIKS